MSRREIRAYDYVNQPYSQVRDALRVDPEAVFRAATTAATSRAESVAAELHIQVAGLQVGAQITTSLGEIEECAQDGSTSLVTRIPMEWKAAQRPRLFPLMSAVLSIYPLTATETQLDFLGHYDPPLGMVGDALDALVGHRIADASVHRFIQEVARHLRTGSS